MRCSCVRAHRPRALRLPLEALGMAHAKDGPGSRTGPSTTSDTKLCPAMRRFDRCWLAALDRRIYRERSKENQIKPELLNRGLFSFCHGKAGEKALPVVQSRHM